MFKKIIILLFFFFLIVYANNDIVVVEEFSSELATTANTQIAQKVAKKSSKSIEKKASFIKSKKIEKKEFYQNKKKQEKKVLKKSSVSNKKMPKLLIIVDDIRSKKQIEFLKNLPFKVTPSIFPPSKMNMHTPRLAKGLKHFMVHLPLQSSSKKMNKMHKTLFIYDSDKKIQKRVAEIRKLFPNAKYVNNHTGSVFTANYKKSKVLIKALHKQGFVFLDSRTTDHSAIRRVDRELHLRYLKNDIFVDNTQSVAYSLKQLKKGIALAKKRGYAVVIGHPHATTFKALKKLKPFLKGVQTVYIDEF